MHGEAEELVCGDEYRGAVCLRIDNHTVHNGRDSHGTYRMWTDATEQRRGPKKYPKVGDSLNDFPEYK